jgi:hypothetical protein
MQLSWQKLSKNDTGSIATNSLIDEVKNKQMKATNLGLWYMQIPSGIVVNPLGEVVTPKTHNGSSFVLVNRKRVAVSKLPKLNFQSAMEFKKVFVG